VKQSINLNHIRYTQDKIESVRALHRTSLPIPHAGGTYPAKALSPILGGLLLLTVIGRHPSVIRSSTPLVVTILAGWILVVSPRTERLATMLRASLRLPLSLSLLRHFYSSSLHACRLWQPFQ
jgi:hypothetical protein